MRCATYVPCCLPLRARSALLLALCGSVWTLPISSHASASCQHRKTVRRRGFAYSPPRLGVYCHSRFCVSSHFRFGLSTYFGYSSRMVLLRELRYFSVFAGCLPKKFGCSSHFRIGLSALYIQCHAGGISSPLWRVRVHLGRT